MRNGNAVERQAKTDTRRESYAAIKGVAAKRRRLILDIVAVAMKPLQVDDVVRALVRMREIPAFDRNAAAPRMTELEKAGFLEASAPHGANAPSEMLRSTPSRSRGGG